MKILKKDLQKLIIEEITKILQEQDGGNKVQASGGIDPSFKTQRQRTFTPRKKSRDTRGVGNAEELHPFIKKLGGLDREDQEKAALDMMPDLMSSQDDAISNLALRIEDAVERLIDVEAVLDSKMSQLQNLEAKVNDMIEAAMADEAPEPEKPESDKEMSITKGAASINKGMLDALKNFKPSKTKPPAKTKKEKPKETPKQKEKKQKRKPRNRFRRSRF